MWFAAMSEYYEHPWFVHFLEKLLEGDAGVLSLLRSNPFVDPAAYVRANCTSITSRHRRSGTARASGGAGSSQGRTFRPCRWTRPHFVRCWKARAGFLNLRPSEQTGQIRVRGRLGTERADRCYRTRSRRNRHHRAGGGGDDRRRCAVGGAHAARLHARRLFGGASAGGQLPGISIDAAGAARARAGSTRPRHWHTLSTTAPRLCSIDR